jgi:hypothetical protein
MLVKKMEMIWLFSSKMAAIFSFEETGHSSAQRLTYEISVRQRESAAPAGCTFAISR